MADDTKNDKGRLYSQIGPYTVVPNSFIEASQTMSLAAFKTFVVLLDMGRQSGRAWPGYETLSTRTGIGSYTTLSKALNELIRAGWIEKNKRFSGTTIYTLQIPIPTESVGMDAPIPTKTVGQSYRKRSLTRTKEKNTTTRRESVREPRVVGAGAASSSTETEGTGTEGATLKAMQAHGVRSNKRTLAVVRAAAARASVAGVDPVAVVDALAADLAKDKRIANQAGALITALEAHDWDAKPKQSAQIVGSFE